MKPFAPCIAAHFGLCARVPLQHAPLLYSSKTSVGIDVSTSTTESPGGSISMGVKVVDAAYVAVAVCKRLRNDASNKNIPSELVRIEAIFGEGATTGRLDSLNQKAKKANEAKENGRRITELNEQLEKNRQVVQQKKEELQTAKASSQKYFDAAAEAANFFRTDKRDAMSVYGRFHAETSAGAASSATAWLTSGTILSTGVASQNLTEAVRSAATYTAITKCIDMSSRPASAWKRTSAPHFRSSWTRSAAPSQVRTRREVAFLGCSGNTGVRRSLAPWRVLSLALMMLGVVPSWAEPIMPFWRMDACPTVSGRALVPLPRPVRADPAPRSLSPMPAALAATAQRTVLAYEGANDRWDTVTGLQEGLSLGALQWNRRARTLYTELLRDLPDEVVAAAGPNIRDGIAAMTVAHRGKREQQAADAHLAAWKNPAPGLVRGLRQVAYAELKAFVAGPLRPRQQKLLDERMSNAWRMATAFEQDRGRTEAPGLVQLAFFFDLNVFAGRDSLWVPHVEALRSAYPTPRALIEAVADWLEGCHPSGIYDAEIALDNAAHWRRLATEADSMSQFRLDLLSLALLRAQRASADNGTGLRGIYQARLMHRLGIIVLGEGYVNGSTRLCRFPPQRPC